MSNPTEIPFGQGGARVPSSLVQKGLQFANNIGLEALTTLIKTLIDQQGGVGVKPFIFDGKNITIDEKAYTSTVGIVPPEQYQSMKAAFLEGRPTLIKTGSLAGDYLVMAFSPDAVENEDNTPSEGLIVYNLSTHAQLDVTISAIIPTPLID